MEDDIVELSDRDADWVFWPESHGPDVDTGGLCDCGHEGLGPAWHLNDCPGVLHAWRARAKVLHDALWDLRERTAD
jgi:hypothetical protein